MTRCVLCLQEVMRLPTGGLTTFTLTVFSENSSQRIPKPGGVSCPTTTGEIEGHRASFATTL